MGREGLEPSTLGLRGGFDACRALRLLAPATCRVHDSESPHHLRQLLADDLADEVGVGFVQLDLGLEGAAARLAESRIGDVGSGLDEDRRTADVRHALGRLGLR